MPMTKLYPFEFKRKIGHTAASYMLMLRSILTMEEYIDVCNDQCAEAIRQYTLCLS